eukprot:6211913-Pleurochrysis_carterae.AAC.2
MIQFSELAELSRHRRHNKTPRKTCTILIGMGRGAFLRTHAQPVCGVIMHHAAVVNLVMIF